MIDNNLIKSDKNSCYYCECNVVILDKALTERYLHNLSLLFCLDICAYKLSNNRYQLAVISDKQSVQNMSDHDVLMRWSLIEPIPKLIEDWLENKDANKNNLVTVVDTIKIWRERLVSLSWFVKKLNVFIHSQRSMEHDVLECATPSNCRHRILMLQNPHAILVAMAYIDCSNKSKGNKEVSTPCVYSSIYQRTMTWNGDNYFTPTLKPLLGEKKCKGKLALPYKIDEYLYLIKWSSMRDRNENTFVIKDIPNILTALNISPVKWLMCCDSFNHTSMGFEIP